MALKVLHLSTYDANGGAARAAYALHRAMLSEGLDSRMLVGRKQTDDPTVQQGDRNRFMVASELDRRLWKLQRSPVNTWRSPARFGSLTAERINNSGADVVHLHWVTDGFLSIETIAKITKPIVWSMYDMWPFAGTEHYGADTPNARWRTSYTKDNRPEDESGFDLDRWTYRRKQRHWRAPMHMVPASTWLEDSVKASALMRDWPVTRIPHVIDTDLFAPMDMRQARQQLGLPQDRQLVLFLASAGIGDRRKGWDLLAPAIAAVKAAQQADQPDLEVIVVGPIPDEDAKQAAELGAGVPIHWHGSVDTSQALRTLYCAADVTAVPSREDNMPLTAMEAQSCGRPVVAFNIGGLPDIVQHDVTGHLSPPSDSNDLARGIRRALQGDQQDAARQHSLRTWSSQPVVDGYESVYRTCIRDTR